MTDRSPGTANAADLNTAMVEQLKADGVLTDPAVEAAFRAVPRHLFLPGMPLEKVYTDTAIPTKHQDGQAISSSSQPAIMAIMLEWLRLARGQRVLEIGAGTGYNAALIAQIVGPEGVVTTVDIDDDIVQAARVQTTAAGLSRVQVICADGTEGYQAHAPYDRIILTVGALDIAPAWWAQLAPQGRIVGPFGPLGGQALLGFVPRGDHLYSPEARYCGFMQLRGAFGIHGSLNFEPPGLSLYSADVTPLNADALFAHLTGPRADLPTSVRCRYGHLHSRLSRWLAWRDPRFCWIDLHNEWLDRDLLPVVTSPTSGDRFAGACGLTDGQGVVALVATPPQPVSGEPGEPVQVFVRSFGADRALTDALTMHVEAWARAGYPDVTALNIRLYPHRAGYMPQPGETVIDRPWNRHVITWSRSEN